MGIAANQGLLMTLTARMGDLEVRAQSLSQSKLINAISTSNAAIEYSDTIETAYGADGTVNEQILNGAQAVFDKKLGDLSKQDKIWDLEIQQISTQHNAAKTQFDSVKSLISDNTEKSFSLFG